MVARWAAGCDVCHGVTAGLHDLIHLIYFCFGDRGTTWSSAWCGATVYGCFPEAMSNYCCKQYSPTLLRDPVQTHSAYCITYKSKKSFLFSLQQLFCISSSSPSAVTLDCALLINCKHLSAVLLECLDMLPPLRYMMNVRVAC